MARLPQGEDGAPEAAESRRDGDMSAPRLRIESFRAGASGTATIAAGGSSFLVDLAQAQSLGLGAEALSPGTELDEAGAALLALAAEAHEAERRGLALLARAEQSTFMLRHKLESRGFSPRAVALALGRLAEQGWLDDSRFARAYGAARLGRRAEGPATLAAALRARGVDAETARAAIAELLGPEERRAALVKAWAREWKRSGGDRDETRSRLRALGFGATEIGEYLDERDD